MPETIAAFLLPSLIQGLGAIGIPIATIAAISPALALGASYLLLGGVALLASSVFTPAKPDAPKPEDGKYNLKQSVPPLTYVLGRVKKGGDYVFLEETGGVAYHVTVLAAHHIQGFVVHFLHDESVGLGVGGYVTSPAHFDSQVAIGTRVGDDDSSAYDSIVAAFPGIWTDDHRGDGLATVAMIVRSVAAEDLQSVYPNGMPVHTAIIDGNDRIYDPRTDSYGYTDNLALHRLWHLTHPVGGKLTLDDIHLPDWIVAADVCDETVTNRSGGTEPRYQGGFWFRADNDPVAVGRIMDQAAELVLYETPEGKVGVHPGAMVLPDIRLTENDIISVNYDPNKRKGTTVLAVRGRYTDPEKGFNTADAAIYGVPYPTDDERTKTVGNQAVQRHNHCARIQKLAYIRANAPRVTVKAHYEPAKLVPYRRFVRVHVPPKMDEAIVEIIGQPKMSLRGLTMEFEGIVVPFDLYEFNAVTEEGIPGANVTPVEPEGVPQPEDFAVTIQTEDVGGGASAAFGEATFTLQSETFQYQVQWEPTAGGTAQSVTGDAGQISVRTNVLADGVQYKFRARTWSAGARSEWTDYQILTAVADPTPPGVVTGVSASGGAGQITFNWTAPNSVNYVGARLYWNTSNTMTGATLAATEYGAPNAADNRIITGISAGTRYGWIVAINGSGVAASPVATGALTVT
ncbi:hypothetical protein [Devosia sp.]|uniref:hypothetical protein n=1 Tax=Devosia sp. TaxID=1871048 RepID=UPI001B190E00|nr:hypothetical protein [Devosia sp.]MBO9589524.1 hypothetical protein [Devosia sp.]